MRRREVSVPDTLENRTDKQANTQNEQKNVLKGTGESRRSPLVSFEAVDLQVHTNVDRSISLYIARLQLMVAYELGLTIRRILGRLHEHVVERLNSIFYFAGLA